MSKITRQRRTAKPRETWAFAVRALPGDGPPVEVRVRRMLNIALRVYCLECVGIKLVQPNPAAPETAAVSTGGA